MPAKKTKSKKDKIPAKVKAYLDKAGIKHEILEHKTVYTAIDAANTLNKKFSEIAKSLIVKADKDYYLILLPADYNLEPEKLKKALAKGGNKEVKTIKIPGEKIVDKALKIKAGALSAFGNLHKLPVIVDKKLAQINKAVFSSGSLNHSVEMAVKDFVKLENAILDNFGVKKKIKIEKAPVKKKTKKAGKTHKKPLSKTTKSKKVTKNKKVTKAGSNKKATQVSTNSKKPVTTKKRKK
ncbi:MAG: YbaK/EbsC family protein [Candidatus Pacebacteria bacterium]|nr:YbaK/EbsC family protein [Candidatus Paceibacterota bacterium]